MAGDRDSPSCGKANQEHTKDGNFLSLLVVRLSELKSAMLVPVQSSSSEKRAIVSFLGNVDAQRQTVASNHQSEETKNMP